MHKTEKKGPAIDVTESTTAFVFNKNKENL